MYLLIAFVSLQAHNQIC